MRNFRILMIDQSDERLRSAKEAFTKAGMTVQVCQSPLMALDIMGRDHFDYILVSHELGRMFTGEEIAAWIADNLETPWTLMSDADPCETGIYQVKDFDDLPCMVEKAVSI